MSVMDKNTKEGTGTGSRWRQDTWESGQESTCGLLLRINFSKSRFLHLYNNNSAYWKEGSGPQNDFATFKQWDFGLWGPQFSFPSVKWIDLSSLWCLKMSSEIIRWRYLKTYKLLYKCKIEIKTHTHTQTHTRTLRILWDANLWLMVSRA